MKRWILFFLCICLTAAGCTATPEAETTQIPQSTSAAEPTDSEYTQPSEPVETIPPLAYQKPLTAVALIPYSESVEDSSGAMLYHYSSQNLLLAINEHAIAQAITLDFTNRNDQLLHAAISDLDIAAADYVGETFFCNLRYDISRLDQNVLSIVGTEQFFDGTHRSGETTFAFNYDMQTGVCMTLRDVLDPNFSADALAACITEALSDRKDRLFEDYTESIDALFSSNVPVENWYFTENGLCFFFNPYDIAPQSQGTVLAEIPYEKLAGIVKDAYFPGESVAFSGSIIMAAFKDAPTDSISRGAEAILDSSGSMYVIHTKGTVQHIRVETGSWAKNGAFQPENTILYAEALTDGYALTLQLQPKDLGKLCITYQSGDEIICTPWQVNS